MNFCPSLSTVQMFQMVAQLQNPPDDVLTLLDARGGASDWTNLDSLESLVGQDPTPASTSASPSASPNLMSLLAPLLRGGAGVRSATSRAAQPPRRPEEARVDLEVLGLMLAPHQVEVLFVLCTLLGGRRKIDVQRCLAELGLFDVLGAMFERLSWESPAPDRQNPMERIHGPGCECNPESALRVQFLRVVHALCDRWVGPDPTPLFP